MTKGWPDLVAGARVPKPRRFVIAPSEDLTVVFAQQRAEPGSESCMTKGGTHLGSAARVPELRSMVEAPG